jgi:hypothetical protein
MLLHFMTTHNPQVKLQRIICMLPYMHDNTSSTSTLAFIFWDQTFYTAYMTIDDTYNNASPITYDC